MLSHFAGEFARYRVLAEGAMAQVGDDALNRVVAPDGNSIAMIVRHISGNLTSRFTDFLLTDGEKPWRDRDAEFEARTYTRAEVDAMWASGWGVLVRAIEVLTDGDLEREVRIRGVRFTVHEALCRASAHIAYHAGQIVLLARMLATREWEPLSIPRGQSPQYTTNPAREKKPD